MVKASCRPNAATGCCAPRRVACFMPCCKESEDELANPIALFRGLAAARGALGYNFSVTLILDGQPDEAPPTATLRALWRLLGLDESSPFAVERGCRVWRFCFGKIPAALYAKGDKLRPGKRYSQLLFHDIVCDYALPPWAYLCLDADVAVTVENATRLLDCLAAKPNCGGMAGVISPCNRDIYTNWVVARQVFQYYHNGNSYRAVDVLSGVSTILCGPFVALKHSAFKAVREEFSWVPDVDDVPGRCLLDLGEDRCLTTCLLRLGHEPTFCKQAFAGTIVPDTLASYIDQQRRWCKTVTFSDLNVVLRPCRYLFARRGRSAWAVVQYIQLVAGLLEVFTGAGWTLAMTALGIADMHGRDGRGWPQIVLGLLTAYVVYFAAVCMRMQSAGRWQGGQLTGHTVLMCALSQWGLARFWLRHIYITLFPDNAVGYYFSTASSVAVAFICMVTVYIVALCCLYLPQRRWLGMWYSAALNTATDSLHRIVIPIFALATLDNYRWCTRGVNHTGSEARPADSAASRKLPCYHVEGGLPRPDHQMLCRARTYKLIALGAFLSFTVGLAALLTILDEVELPGSRTTVFDVAEIAGYALQTTRVFMLVITLVAAHQRRDWKVLSPAYDFAVGTPVQHNHVIA
ncbi:g5165 [Coccomyxa elongata]